MPENKLSLVLTEHPEGGVAIEIQLSKRPDGSESSWTGPGGRVLSYALAAMVTGAGDGAILPPRAKAILEFHVSKAMEEEAEQIKALAPAKEEVNEDS